MSDNKEYRVMAVLNHNHHRYGIGDTVALPPEQARVLLEHKVVCELEPVSAIVLDVTTKSRAKR